MNSFQKTRSLLIERLKEKAPARVQLISGPRQVGKTHLLLEVARMGELNATYLTADSPEATLPGWWERHFRRALERARVRPAVLMVDEVASLPEWSRLLKSSADELHRMKIPLHLVVTGSSALTLGVGSRESMAGRFERMTLFHWTPRDLAEAFSLPAERAIDLAVTHGCYPGAVPFLDDFPRWRTYVRDSLVEPAIGRDILNLEAIRRPGLLRQLFALAALHPAEILSLTKIAGSLNESGALDTLSHYLELLQEAWLVTALKKFSTREIRRRASAPKLVPLSNAFPTALAEGGPPSQKKEPRHWGRLVENCCLTRFLAAGFKVHYWREEPLEVDAILQGESGNWAVEVKSGPFETGELAPLLEFCRRNHEFEPLLLGDKKHLPTATRAGIRALDWRTFLWTGGFGHH